MTSSDATVEPRARRTLRDAMVLYNKTMAMTKLPSMLSYFTPAAKVMRDIERYRRRPMPPLCLEYVDGEPVLGTSIEQAALTAEQARLNARVQALADCERQIAARALDVAARERIERSTQQACGLEMLVTRRRSSDLTG